MEKQPVAELKARTPTLEKLKEGQFDFTDTDKWTLNALRSHCATLRKRMETERPEDTLDVDRELYHALFEVVSRLNENETQTEPSA